MSYFWLESTPNLTIYLLECLIGPYFDMTFVAKSLKKGKLFYGTPGTFSGLLKNIHRINFNFNPPPILHHSTPPIPCNPTFSLPPSLHPTTPDTPYHLSCTLSPTLSPTLCLSCTLSPTPCHPTYNPPYNCIGVSTFGLPVCM